MSSRCLSKDGSVLCGSYPETRDPGRTIWGCRFHGLNKEAEAEAEAKKKKKKKGLVEHMSKEVNIVVSIGTEPSIIQEQEKQSK